MSSLQYRRASNEGDVGRAVTALKTDAKLIDRIVNRRLQQALMLKEATIMQIINKLPSKPSSQAREGKWHEHLEDFIKQEIMRSQDTDRPAQLRRTSHETLGALFSKLDKASEQAQEMRNASKINNAGLWDVEDSESEGNERDATRRTKPLVLRNKKSKSASSETEKNKPELVPVANPLEDETAAPNRLMGQGRGRNATLPAWLTGDRALGRSGILPETPNLEMDQMSSRKRKGDFISDTSNDLDENPTKKRTSDITASAQNGETGSCRNSTGIGTFVAGKECSSNANSAGTMAVVTDTIPKKRGSLSGASQVQQSNAWVESQPETTKPPASMRNGLVDSNSRSNVTISQADHLQQYSRGRERDPSPASSNVHSTGVLNGNNSPGRRTNQNDIPVSYSAPDARVTNRTIDRSPSNTRSWGSTMGTVDSSAKSTSSDIWGVKKTTGKIGRTSADSGRSSTAMASSETSSNTKQACWGSKRDTGSISSISHEASQSLGHTPRNDASSPAASMNQTARTGSGWRSAGTSAGTTQNAHMIATFPTRTTQAWGVPTGTMGLGSSVKPTSASSNAKETSNSTNHKNGASAYSAYSGSSPTDFGSRPTNERLIGGSLLSNSSNGNGKENDASDRNTSGDPRNEKTMDSFQRKGDLNHDSSDLYAIPAKERTSEFAASAKNGEATSHQNSIGMVTSLFERGSLSNNNSVGTMAVATDTIPKKRGSISGASQVQQSNSWVESPPTNRKPPPSTRNGLSRSSNATISESVHLQQYSRETDRDPSPASSHVHSTGVLNGSNSPGSGTNQNDIPVSYSASATRVPNRTFDSSPPIRRSWGSTNGVAGGSAKSTSSDIWGAKKTTSINGRSSSDWGRSSIAMASPETASNRKQASKRDTKSGKSTSHEVSQSLSHTQRNDASLSAASMNQTTRPGSEWRSTGTSAGATQNAQMIASAPTKTTQGRGLRTGTGSMELDSTVEPTSTSWGAKETGNAINQRNGSTAWSSTNESAYSSSMLPDGGSRQANERLVGESLLSKSSHKNGKGDNTCNKPAPRVQQTEPTMDSVAVACSSALRTSNRGIAMENVVQLAPIAMGMANTGDKNNEAALSFSNTDREKSNPAYTHTSAILKQNKLDVSGKIPTNRLLENYNVLKQPTNNVFVQFVKENVNDPYSCYAVSKRPAGRRAMDINFTPTQISFNQFESTVNRLQHWEIGWCVNWIVQVGVTSLSCESDSASSSLAHLSFQLENTFWNETGKAAVAHIPSSVWGNASIGKEICHNDMRLMLMALPVNPTKKGADTHLWPKGTFIQITSEDGGVAKPIRIVQRKQAGHDENEWKGMSKILDVTPFIKDPKRHHRIDIMSFDKDSFIFVLSLCKYCSDEKIYASLTLPDSPNALLKLSKEEGRRKVSNFSVSATLAVDDDIAIGNITCSLRDSTTKQLLVTPVRGKDCCHFQCFDLMTYLKANTFPSGQRWRCRGCEKFVSPHDLEICGFTEFLIEECHKKHGSRFDKVEFYPNGTYIMSEAKKPNSARQKRSAGRHNNGVRANGQGAIDIL